MRNEAVRFNGAVEKHGSTDLERASQLIKESMDKKFGAPWNVVVGQHYLGDHRGGETPALPLLRGQFAILLWKAHDWRG